MQVIMSGKVTLGVLIKMSSKSLFLTMYDKLDKLTMKYTYQEVTYITIIHRQMSKKTTLKTVEHVCNGIAQNMFNYYNYDFLLWQDQA